MEIQNYTYLRFVHFQDVLEWDVKRYKRSKLEFLNGVRLYEILKPYKKSISRKDIIINRFQIIKKIDFSGNLYLRGFEEIKAYKGNLNIVPSNSLIYSKINIRHGCIYYNSKDSMPFCVSSEYPTYTFDDKKIDGEFLKKILRSNVFKRILNTKTSGISKARVKENEFLNIQIPLPSLIVQNALVSAYDTKIQRAEELEKQANETEKNIDKYLMEALGIEQKTTKNHENKNGFLQMVRFSDISEWGVDKLVEARDTICIYESYKISDLATQAFRGKSPVYDENNNDSIILNQKCNRWNEIDISYARTVNTKWLNSLNKNNFTREGDVLINSTGEGTIGRASYIDKKSCNLMYDSHLLLLRLETNKINPQYFVLLFNSEFGQEQVDIVKSAQATKQTELGIDNLYKIYIPLPPLSIQNEIVYYVNEQKEQIKTLKQNALELRETALKEFEKEIFE